MKQEQQLAVVEPQTITLSDKERVFLTPLLHQRDLFNARLEGACGVIIEQHAGKGNYTLSPDGTQLVPQREPGAAPPSMQRVKEVA